MQNFKISRTVDAQACVDHGYPNPDIDPEGWLTAIRRAVARQIQHCGLDLDTAKLLVVTAIERAFYYEAPTPMIVPGSVTSEVLREMIGDLGDE